VSVCFFLLTLAIPECFRDEYRTHYKALFKWAVYFTLFWSIVEVAQNMSDLCNRKRQASNRRQRLRLDAATWRTRRNNVFCDSGPLAPLSKTWLYSLHAKLHTRVCYLVYFPNLYAKRRLWETVSVNSNIQILITIIITWLNTMKTTTKPLWYKQCTAHIEYQCPKP